MAQTVDVPRLRTIISQPNSGAFSVPILNNPQYAAPESLAVAGLVLMAILLITRYASRYWANIAVRHVSTTLRHSQEEFSELIV